MFTSFSTALSALTAMASAIDVVGNDLANVNTPGFKISDVVFRDLVSQSIGPAFGATQVGVGTAHMSCTVNGVLDEPSCARLRRVDVVLSAAP